MKAPIKNNLKEYRLKSGLLQKDVAKRLGFKSWDRICRWEQGKKYPHALNLLQLAKLYNAKPEELYEI